MRFRTPGVTSILSRRPRWPALGLAALLTFGCSGDDDDTPTPTPVPGDVDGDGYSPDTGDCNELSSAVYPGAEESCNGIDDDCDDEVDPGCDEDGDGHQGLNNGGDDCDDTLVSVYPGAPEVCDSLDNNCDEAVDNAPDQDSDGFGPCAVVGLPADCNDADPAIYPGALELLDGLQNDCSGTPGQEQIQPQGAAFTLVGEYADDLAGSWIGRAGDLNGDGFDDLLIGAPRADGGAVNAGKVYLFFGGPGYALENASALSPRTLDLSYADVTLRGESSGDQAGSFAVGVGDVDGDELDDLWVGAPQSASGAGAAYLLLGREDWSDTPNLSLAEADAVFRSVDPSGALGPASGGDFDGDGINDLLIGAPGEAGGAGAAYLLRGGEDLLELGDTWVDVAAYMPGQKAGDKVGSGVSLGGDLQGDGLRDIVIAAPGASTLWILFGSAEDKTLTLDRAEVSVVGTSGDAAGSSFSFDGDVNHDGYDDLIIGAPLAGDAGEVYVVLGKPSGLAVQIPLESADLTLTGPSAGQLGRGIGGGGDLNGDRIDDFVVGAPGVASAWLIPGWQNTSPPSDGPVTTLSPAVFTGATSSQTGSAQALVGDLNGDGAVEWLIGTPRESTGGTDAGGAYLIMGYLP